MNEAAKIVSIRPSEMVEGGIVPVDRNLLWKECRFNIFEYKKKSGEVVARTTALRIKYVDDTGQETEQQYSVTDPERFIPSADGKTLVAIGSAENLSKSSNFYLLMNALVSSGFPENKLSGDVSVLDNLYTHNIGLPEPTRSGLARPAAVEGEALRERVISVPSVILRLPWEKGKGKGAKAAPAAAVDESTDEAVTAQALAFVGKVVDESEGPVSRQQLAVKLFKDLAKDPNKDAIAKLIFSPEFSAALLANGFSVDGEDISKA